MVRSNERMRVEIKPISSSRDQASTSKCDERDYDVPKSRLRATENYLVILEINKSRKQRHLQKFPNKVQQEGENRNMHLGGIEYFVYID